MHIRWSIFCHFTRAESVTYRAWYWVLSGMSRNKSTILNPILSFSHIKWIGIFYANGILNYHLSICHSSVATYVHHSTSNAMCHCTNSKVGFNPSNFAIMSKLQVAQLFHKHIHFQQKRGLLVPTQPGLNSSRRRHHHDKMSQENRPVCGKAPVGGFH